MNNSEEELLTNVIRNNGTWHNEFADKLITENYLLTALEFHAELTESGKELPKLKEFFSNPGHFEHQTINKPEVVSATLRM